MNRPEWLPSLGRPRPCPAISIEVERSRGEVAVICSGDLDVQSSESFMDAVRRAGRGRPEVVRFDLRAVDLVDSTGLRHLLRAIDEVEAGGAAVEVKPAAQLHRLLELSGVRLAGLV